MSIVRRGEEEICKRYRPQRFSEVVGNKAILKSLKKAIENGNTRAKVYLFEGAPGTGKTTTARIMAMGLNCLTNGDTVEPCLECDNCILSLQDQASHVSELNAAILNKKEDVLKHVVDKMYHSTFTGRNNVFIIDEYHCILNAAQQPLLKALEEPPKNTYIFLCTTQIKKIDKAILTRCERYSFINPIQSEKIELLASVNEQEGWGDQLNAEDKKKFLKIVTFGSFREVLRTYDQAIRMGVDSLEEIQSDDDKTKNKLPSFLLKAEYTNVINMIQEMKKEAEEKEILFNTETIEIGILGYMRTILLRFNGNWNDDYNAKQALKAAYIIETLTRPIGKDYSYEPKAGFLLKIYEICKTIKDI